jgi:hypothetical protein
MKELLYNDNNIALFYDKESAIFIEFRRNATDKGLGVKTKLKPKWYERLEKINSILKP